MVIVTYKQIYNNNYIIFPTNFLLVDLFAI